MKIQLVIAAAFVALSFVPLAAAEVGQPDLDTHPCLVESRTLRVGGQDYSFPDAQTEDRNVDVGPVHVQVDGIHVDGGEIYVPGPITYTTPSVCYGFLFE